MKLDFTPLVKAEAQLENALRRYEEFKNDPRLRDVLRAGVIQTFEYTYELACKMLHRHLINVSVSSTELRQASFPQLIRAGYARGLLREELLAWKEFRDRRNSTSHGYDEEKAQEVFEAVPRFLTEVRHLTERLHVENGMADDV